MSTAAARKAWNQAMKVTAGATALPPALQQPKQRRSGRRKDTSSRSSRKKTVVGENDIEYQQAVWIDDLEGVDPNLVDHQQQSGETNQEDEEYDELEEIDGPKRKRPRKRAAAPKKEGVIPKRFLPRTLAGILLEESARGGRARAFVEAQYRPARPTSSVPKLCPVTGLEARYHDPVTGMPYRNSRALEQLRERSPPWMSLGGHAAFAEAVNQILEK